VITPLVVNPVNAGLCKEPINDREVLLCLAKIGRMIQKWVNESLGREEDRIPRSSSSDSNVSDESSSFTPRENKLNAGEFEVARFADLLFKTDGALTVMKKPDADEVSEARQVIAAVLKKNYKLLRELESTSDRQQALNKHLGLQHGKLFSSFTRQTTQENLKLSCKFSSVPEALNTDAVRSESVMTAEFSVCSI
jgi:hypothetical protein